MVFDVTHNGFHQGWNILESPAPDSFIRDLPEPALHHVQPRAGSRDKMKVETEVLAQPGFDPWMFVGRVVVHDEMQVQVGRRLRVDELEEADKLLMPVSRHAIADDFAIEHAQSGE